MATEEVAKKHAKKKHRKSKEHHRRHPNGHRRHHGAKHGKKKSSSKKKKGCLDICGKKKEHKDNTRTKSTHKKHKSKTLKASVPAPAPALANEQLGNVVLVKDLGSSKADEVKAAPAAAVPSIPPTPIGAPNADKKNSYEDEKIKDITPEKKDVAPKQIEAGEVPKAHVAAADVPEKEEDDKKSRWVRAVNAVVEDPATVVTEFAKVAGFVLPSVSRSYWLQNMEMNRFSDVVCMDHSRVVLNDGNYIHASWVDQTEKKAIATQLPLMHTAGRFWQMVLENRVKGILMILTEEEYKHMGGNFVFPLNKDFLHYEDEDVRVGDFQRVRVSKNWTMRVLSVASQTVKTFVHVHHLTSWPHGGVPSEPLELWQVQSVLRRYSGPIVYLSLSGCGRAGTYATFEVAHSGLHSERATFGVEESLRKVRSCRMHAVQNVVQFSLVHALLAEHVLGNGLCKQLAKCAQDVRPLAESLIVKPNTEM